MADPGKMFVCCLESSEAVRQSGWEKLKRMGEIEKYIFFKEPQRSKRKLKKETTVKEKEKKRKGNETPPLTFKGDYSTQRFFMCFNVFISVVIIILEYEDIL